MSLVMGAIAATYSLDDISLTQSCENWPTPWLPPAPLGSLYTGFEDCTGAIPRMDSATSSGGARYSATSSGGARDSATSGVGSSGGSPIAAELYAPMAARTGQLGMRLKVRRHLRIDEERPKLILGSLILADASRASDAILLSLWAKMQPGETAEHGETPPSITFELLDVNRSYTWIGHWRACNMTHGRAWTKCAAEVPITPALALHVIQVSILFGAVRASYLVDDLAVEL